MSYWRVTSPPVESLSTELTMMQVHADASNFADGVTKEDAYEQVLMQAEGLFIGQRNWVRFFLFPCCHC